MNKIKILYLIKLIINFNKYNNNNNRLLILHYFINLNHILKMLEVWILPVTQNLFAQQAKIKQSKFLMLNYIKKLKAIKFILLLF